MIDDRETILSRVRPLIDPVVDKAGLELVDVELTGGHGRAILRVLVDRPERVTLDECVRVNRALSDLLDVEDPIPYTYTLEVCSPGLDRPFKTLRDYERAIGKPIRIVTRENFEGTNVHIGRLETCSDTEVAVRIGETLRIIPVSIVQKAQKEIVWE